MDQRHEVEWRCCGGKKGEMRVILSLLLLSLCVAANAQVFGYNEHVVVPIPTGGYVTTMFAAVYDQRFDAQASGWVANIPGASSGRAVLHITSQMWGLRCSPAFSQCSFRNLLGLPSATSTTYTLFVQVSGDPHVWYAMPAAVTAARCPFVTASVNAPCVPLHPAIVNRVQDAYNAASAMAAIVAISAIALLLVYVVLKVWEERSRWRVPVAIVGGVAAVLFFAFILRYMDSRTEPRTVPLANVASPVLLSAQMQGATNTLQASILAIGNATNSVATAVPAIGIASAAQQTWAYLTHDMPLAPVNNTLAVRWQNLQGPQPSWAAAEEALRATRAATSAVVSTVRAYATLPSYATLEQRLQSALSVANTTLNMLLDVEQLANDVLVTKLGDCNLTSYGPSCNQTCACNYWLCDRGRTGSGTCPPAIAAVQSNTPSTCNTAFGAHPLASGGGCDPAYPCVTNTTAFPRLVGANCTVGISCITRHALEPYPQYPDDPPTCMSGCRYPWSGPNCGAYNGTRTFQPPAPPYGEPAGPTCSGVRFDGAFHVCTPNGRLRLRHLSSPFVSGNATLAQTCAPCTNGTDVIATIYDDASGETLAHGRNVTCALPATAAQISCSLGGFPVGMPAGQWPPANLVVAPFDRSSMLVTTYVFDPQLLGITTNTTAPHTCAVGNGAGNCLYT